MAFILLAAPSHGAVTGVQGQVLFRGQGYGGVYVEAFSLSPDKGEAGKKEAMALGE